MPGQSGVSRGTGMALFAMGLGVLVIANDFTALNVALPAIEQDFDVDVGTIQWTVNAYALTYGMVLVTGGRDDVIRSERIVGRVTVVAAVGVVHPFPRKAPPFRGIAVIVQAGQAACDGFLGCRDERQYEVGERGLGAVVRVERHGDGVALGDLVHEGGECQCAGGARLHGVAGEVVRAAGRDLEDAV